MKSEMIFEYSLVQFAAVNHMENHEQRDWSENVMYKQKQS